MSQALKYFHYIAGSLKNSGLHHSDMKKSATRRTLLELVLDLTDIREKRGDQDPDGDSELQRSHVEIEKVQEEEPLL